MESWKINAKGSELHDTFMQKHKELPGEYYLSDIDMVWIEKSPAGIVAFVDYKPKGGHITFAEALLYNTIMTEAPVYIVKSDYPESGPFDVGRYLGGNWKPDPPDVDVEHVTTVTDWPEFGKWEASVRSEYKKRRGWNGNLRGIEESGEGD